MKNFLLFSKSALSLLIAGVFGLQGGATETETTYEVGGLFYRLSDNLSAMVVPPPDIDQDSPTYGGNIVIPSHINIGETEYEVSEIGLGAFRGPNISSIFVPNTVRFANEGAYIDLTLDSISVPSGMSTSRLTYIDTSIKRMILRAEEDSNVSIGNSLPFHGICVVDTLDVAPADKVFISIFQGEIDQLHFRHLEEVWPHEYVFWYCKDPESPVYIVMDDEVPPVAMGPYADVTTIGGTLLFVPDGTEAAYEAAPFWKTARGIYPQSKLPELEDLLKTDAVSEVASDVKEGTWSLNGRSLTVGAESTESCRVFNMDGRYLGTLNGGCTMTLQPGVYIIACGNLTEKLVVR